MREAIRQHRSESSAGLTRYLVAVLATAAATGARAALTDYIGGRYPFLPYFAAVAASAAFGGWGPGMAATALSAAAAAYFFDPPLYSLRIDSGAEFLVTAVFIGVCGAISLFVELLHASRRRAEEEGQRRAASEERLKETLGAHTRELANMQRLHAVGNRMVRSGEPEALLLDLVDTAIAVSGADKGNIQLLDRGILRLAASRGFEKPFLAHFDAVDGACSVCGAAMAAGERVLVEDIESSPLFEGTPEIAVQRAAGVRALQSTPLFSRRGQLVGMLSTHYARPTRPAEADLHALDLLARQAADWIDRTRSEAELARLSEQLQIVTDSMAAPVTRCTRDLRYAWVSRPYADWLRRPPGEIVGRPIEDVVGSRAMETLRPYFERVLDGEVVRYEEEVEFRGIGPRWIQAVYTPTRDDHGAVDGWVAVVIDIHARKQAETELRAADARKERFLATLAHELRNPLAPLRNALEILRRPGLSAAVAEEARAAMDRQLSHVVRLVDDLLDVSRINRDVLELRLEDCDLRAVVAQAVENVRPFLDAGGHALSVTLPEQAVVLRGDPIRLAQIFGNLLHNACKFSDSGAPVTLTADRTDGRVDVTIRDRGVGFAEEDRERLFEMFTRLDGQSGGALGGLGVGLALVRRLVEMHGGRVDAISDGPGRGAAFRVTLPERTETTGTGLAPAAERGAGSAAESAPNGPALRVLVVDDNRDSASSLATLLELSGHEARVAHDGEGAVFEAEAFGPDVILLDIGLPGIDGYEAARRIRGLPRGREILLVAVTGWGQEEDRRRSSEAGFDHHMVKPLRAAALEALLATATRRSSVRPSREPAEGDELRL